MTEPEAQPLPPNTAGLGCGVLSGASVMSLLFFAQAVLAPRVAEWLGRELTASGWMALSAGVGVVTAVLVGLLAAQALKSDV